MLCLLANSRTLSKFKTIVLFASMLKQVALALIKGGLEKKGSVLIAPMENENIEVEITSPIFIDPENQRVNQ